MSTVNYELGKKSAKGIYPIYARISNGKEKKRVRLEITARESDIRGGKVSSRLVLNAINSELNKIERDILEKEEEGRREAAEHPSGDERQSVYIDFIKFGRDHVKELINENREKTSQSYKTALNNLCMFIGRDTLDIRCINKSFLQEYEAWFKKNNFGARAWELYMSCLRALHNKAKRVYNDEDEEVYVVKNSPFDKIDFVRSRSEKRKVEKRALDASAIKAIYKLPDSGNEMTDMARDAFLLSFFLCGMNAVDMYAYNTPIKIGGYVEYYRSKTESRSGEDSFIRIKVQKETKHLVSRLEGVTRTFLFHDKYSSTDCLNAALNKGLKRLAEYCNEYYGREVLPSGLTFYSARHTWATIAANDCGVPIQVVDKSLCHVIDSVAAQSYIRKDFRDVDKANREVIDFVMGK